jgi:CheY-like chemotaxis protein
MASTHPLRILLAEDNTVNQRVGLLMLSRLGYVADLAPNGHQGVNAIERAEYDLVLMDIQMPDTNGIDAARVIRESWVQVSFHFCADRRGPRGRQTKIPRSGF